MSENNAPESTQEAGNGRAPEATTDEQRVEASAPEAQEESPQAKTKDDAAFWREEKKKADREAKNLRERLKAYDDAEEERKKAAMSDLERVQSEAESIKAERDTVSSELEQAYATIARMTEEQEVRSALTEAGIKPERMRAAMRLVDFDAIDVDDDGNLTGVKDVVKAVKKEASEFFRGSDDISSSSNPPGEPPAGKPGVWNMPQDQFEEQMRRISNGERFVPS